VKKTKEQKKATSEKMTAHWRRVRAVAEIITAPASEVNSAWSQLKERGLVNPILIGEEGALEKARMLLTERKASGRVTIPKGGYAKKQVQIYENLNARVSGMLWTIRRCGDIDLARDAFERAMSAVEERV